MRRMTRNKFRFNPSARADAERYRGYHEAKARIPLDLPPQQFEEEVKKLARKYHI